MNREFETKRLQTHARRAWIKFTSIYPGLINFECPKIILCARLSVSGGLSFYTENEIKISFKHYLFFGLDFIKAILIHELAHQVDYNIYGEESMKALEGHGINWQNIMIKYGAKPDRYLSDTMPKMKLADLLEMRK